MYVQEVTYQGRNWKSVLCSVNKQYDHTIRIFAVIVENIHFIFLSLTRHGDVLPYRTIKTVFWCLPQSVIDFNLWSAHIKNTRRPRETDFVNKYISLADLLNPHPPKIHRWSVRFVRWPQPVSQIIGNRTLNRREVSASARRPRAIL